MAQQRRHLGLLPEAAAGIGALALSVIVVAHLVASERVSLLYSDGDSLITVLVARSIAAGQPQDWAMSSVLFLPEVAAYGTLALLGLTIMATLTVNAVLNLTALYAVLRFVARAPLAALAAFAAFVALALLDSSASRESLELASLMATTTYYSATVIGALATLGLVLRLPGRVPVAVIAAVALVSTVSNPIYLAWAVVPFTLLLLAKRDLSLRVRLFAIAALAGGAGAGMLVRVPLAPWITNTGAGYVQPSQWEESLQYYGDLVADRLQDAGGVVSILGWGILMLLGIALTVLAVRRREPRIATLAAVSWMAPVVVIVGAIALGTHAARYLQPAAFLPVLAIAALVELLPPVHRFALPGIVVIAGVVAVAVLPSVVRVASHEQPSADVACVTSWVEQSGRTGAGQFWTVRAPKAYAVDPIQLVQVDLQLNEYAWLVNRSDFATGQVSFLVTGPESFAFDLPKQLADEPHENISCGSYEILDFERRIVTLGPPHS